MNGVREFNYRYHRLGLDMMDEKVAEGRAEITNSLELLQKVLPKPSRSLHVSSESGF